MGLFTQLLSLNRLARRLLTISKNGNERIIPIVGKERCIKEHIVSELLFVSSIYLTS